MKVMIAGFGSIGRRHFRNLLSLGERDIVLYRTQHSTLPDEELAGFAIETDLRSALAYQPEAVIISNPTAMHLEVAIPAAQCGCHLLIEKPISHSMARMDELQESIEQNDVRVLVGYQFRFHPGLKLVNKLVHEHAIGEPLSVHAHWGEFLPAWHPWEDYKKGYAARPELGGGVILTLSHPLDYLHWIFGEVESITGFSSRNGLNLPVEDNADILLRFTSGVLGSVHVDYNQRPPAHWLEVIGTMGTIHWDNSDGAVHMLRVGHDGSNKAQQDFPLPADFERNTLFLDELRHFLEVATGLAKPVCTLQDGIQALRLGLSALQQQVINLT